MKTTSKKLVEEIIQCKIPENWLGIWYLGQSGMALKYLNTTIYLDPYLSDALEKLTRGRPDEHVRRYLPPLQAADVTNADAVFCSHDHYDHLDRGALGMISRKSPGCTFIIPPIARRTCIDIGINRQRILDIDTENRHAVGEFSFISIPAAHPDLAHSNEFGYHYRGYIIKAGNVSVYHAGDTVMYKRLVEKLKRQKVDIAFLPINGRDWFRDEKTVIGNMNYREAAELVIKAGINLLIPVHFGMHKANTENPGYLVDYLNEKYPFQKFHIMVPGEGIMYSKKSAGITFI